MATTVHDAAADSVTLRLAAAAGGVKDPALTMLGHGTSTL
jgi:hypothetical protein